MNKIHAFGCSFTAQHRWRYLYTPTSIDDPGVLITKDDWVNGIVEWKKDGWCVRSYAISGGSNNMQVIAYGNAVHKKQIRKDDIVLWQLTCPNRYGIRCPEDDDAVEEKALGMNSILVDDNIYSDIRVKMMNYNMLEQYTSEKNNKESQRSIGLALYGETELYSILWGLNGIKRQNEKTLVMFGWDSAFHDKGKVVKFLKDNDIDYIQESIMEYSIRKGHPQQDSNHPVKEGYEDFTQKKLLPKLRKLGWV